MMTVKRPFQSDQSAGMIPRVSLVREEFWIFTLVLFVLGSVYICAIYTFPGLNVPATLALFTILMGTHAVLHILGPRLRKRKGWLFIYFILQGVLAFAITQMMAGSQLPFTLYLYLALAAEAIGLLSTRPGTALTIVAMYLGMGLLNFIWLWGWAPLPSFLGVAVPQALVIIAIVTLYFRQANARCRAQELLLELETAHRQLGEYAAQVEDLTLVAERQRMARELHDTLAQGLAGLILQLEAMDLQLSRGRIERVQVIVQQAMQRARTSLASARDSIDNLRADQSANFDLAEAARLEAEQFTSATGIACTLDLELPASIPALVREQAIRFISEGLANTARHAKARHVRIHVGGSDALEITLADDGIGFDPIAVDGRAGHYGLVGLRERAHLAGGTVDVISAPGQGTILNIALPMKANGHG